MAAQPTQADFVKGFSMLALLFGLLLLSLFGYELIHQGPALIPDMGALHGVFIGFLVTGMFQFAWAAVVPGAKWNLIIGLTFTSVAAVCGIFYLAKAHQKSEELKAAKATKVITGLVPGRSLTDIEIFWPIFYLIAMTCFGLFGLGTAMNESKCRGVEDADECDVEEGEE